MMTSGEKDVSMFVMKTTAAAAVGISAVMYYYLSSNKRNNNSNDNDDKKNKFPVNDYGTFPRLPLPLRIIAKLPKNIRMSLLASSQVPKIPKDGIDILNEALLANEHDENMMKTIQDYQKKYTPYQIQELVPNKLWKVQYEFMLNFDFFNTFVNMFGIDMSNETKIIESASTSQMKERLTKDLILLDKYKSLSTDELEQLLTYGAGTCLNTFVVKLDNNKMKKNNKDDKEDQLLLYNPCRMHQSFINFLNSKGKVSYIVSGSSGHTNMIPHTVEIFPNAKVICASAANMKCQKAVGMMNKQADYLYDIHRNVSSPYDDRLIPNIQGTFEDAVDALNDSGITLYHIHGENSVQPLVVIAYDYLLMCDIMYSPLQSCLYEFETNESIPRCFYRIFYYSSVILTSPSNNGLLPAYRYMWMDPKQLFSSKLLLDPPLPDGTGCQEMTKSLKILLNDIPYTKATGVHYTYTNTLNRNELRNGMNETWKWINHDKSLLLENNKEE